MMRITLPIKPFPHPHQTSVKYVSSVAFFPLAAGLPPFRNIRKCLEASVGHSNQGAMDIVKVVAKDAAKHPLSASDKAQHTELSVLNVSSAKVESPLSWAIPSG